MKNPAKTAAKRLPPAIVLTEAAPVYFATGPGPVVVAHADQLSPLAPEADDGFDDPVAAPAQDAQVDEPAAGVETFAELASEAHNDHWPAALVEVGLTGLPVAEPSAAHDDQVFAPLVGLPGLAVSEILTVTVTVEG